MPAHKLQESIQSSVPRIAVIGGGIVGLVLALGGIQVDVYEQSSGFREIGAGVAFTANAIKCMGLIDSNIVDAFRAVATPNGDPNESTDYLQWIDGFHEGGKLLFRLDAGYKGFEGCHRAHLLEELSKRIDHKQVHFRKRLASLVETDAHVVLEFEDGSTAEADAVIGCDGIKSTVRRLLLGSEDPAAHPYFSHKVAYRALVPMERAEKALGRHIARRQHMHVGPGAHMLHFPLANQTMLNIVAFADEPADWPHGSQNMVTSGTRQEVEATFARWGSTCRTLASLLPPQLEKWAVFDAYDHPLSSYAKGRVCLAGDAAHASAPHHGAGAGMGIEDALALCALLEPALKSSSRLQSGWGASIAHAFSVYSTVRQPRSQWLVRSSREVCDIYEWKYPGTGTDMSKCLEEITYRSHKLWYFDIEGMLADLRRLQESGTQE
ncbi:FAD/NAD(P)-binding domain-containing protein [Apiospora saccharicola]